MTETRRCEDLPMSERTKIRRHPERGSHDRETVDSILDDGFVCHVGFTTDQGPVVIPTSYGRVGDKLYIHGSPASRMMRALKSGTEVCVAVTLVDGLVLARSATHHSVNFRSVILFGHAVAVEGLDEKRAALLALLEHVIPGRSGDVRPPSDKEVKATLVLSLPLAEVSAKVRDGGPADEPEDLSLPVWAGVLPFSTAHGPPQPEPDLHESVPTPGYVTRYRRPLR